MRRHPDNLAAARAEATARWSLDIGPAFEPGGTCSWTAPAIRSDKTPVVLKIGWPHVEAKHEAEGLQFWAGDGVVSLVDSMMLDDTPILLLERCQPGAALDQVVGADESDIVITGLLRRLWREPPATHQFRPLTDMCGQWADSAKRAVDERKAAYAGVIEAGIEMFRSLPTTASDAVVLFTDLHAGNVLAAQREPWLAIDPKPYVGDPTYDALQHLQNGPRLAADPIALIRRIADLLDLDSDRLRQWTFARCCVEAAHDPAFTEVATRLAP